MPSFGQTNNTNPADLVPYVQSIYDQFKAIGVTLPLADIPFLIYNSVGSGGDPLSFSTYCEDKLLALPVYANIIALGLNRHQNLAMATLPKFNQIREFLMTNPLKNQIPAHHIQVDLLEVNDDVVSMVPNE